MRLRRGPRRRRQWSCLLVALGCGCADSPPAPPVCGPLVEDGVVARYFIDEAAEGSGPTQLRDGVAPALDLSIGYGQMAFDEPAAGQRALLWTALGAAGGAVVTVAGSKLDTRLNDATAVTLELVVALSNAGEGKELSRLSHIGPPGADAPSDFTLALPALGAIELYWNGGARAGSWTFPPASGRRVIHLVLDTDTTERVGLYVDGQLATANGEMVATPLEGERIELSNDATWALGNRPGGGHSFMGRMHYAAIYDIALSAQALEQNVGRLRGCDDG